MKQLGLVLIGCAAWVWSWWPVVLGYQFSNGQGAMLGLIARTLYVVSVRLEALANKS